MKPLFHEPEDDKYNTIKYQWRKKPEKPRLLIWILLFLLLEAGVATFFLWR